MHVSVCSRLFSALSSLCRALCWNLLDNLNPQRSKQDIFNLCENFLLFHLFHSTLKMWSMCLLKALSSINKIFYQILLQFLNRYLFIYNPETLVYTFFAFFLYLQNDFFPAVQYGFPDKANLSLHKTIPQQIFVLH